ncbi:CPXCG motif-containing cysteine-rich protein [Neiella marina]|uniref:CPXCG motif-containing cysteine-rich protein n=1 Tax=Neiella holothuriorum TaxID=2870530 RepID=A0ABS7EH60_9GAMM|nr:CPXCG motif-containing cysteine-rich protein [Neiella holothuriorum]MBW8191540.1 CPXCG motif-containing cysteine-rich protein [Neiella holothuriorum]
MELTKQSIHCPTCDHGFSIYLDYSRGAQDYYDDCPNCCTSYRVRFSLDDQHRQARVFIDADDEQIY